MDDLGCFLCSGFVWMALREACTCVCICACLLESGSKCVWGHYAKAGHGKGQGRIRLLDYTAVLTFSSAITQKAGSHSSL